MCRKKSHHTLGTLGEYLVAFTSEVVLPESPEPELGDKRVGKGSMPAQTPEKYLSQGNDGVDE